MLQETTALYFNASEGTYVQRPFKYNLATTAQHLSEISTDLICEVSMRGVIVPKAAISGWLTPHSDGTYSAWIQGVSTIITRYETALIRLVPKQVLKDRIARTRLLLSALEALENPNPA